MIELATVTVEYDGHKPLDRVDLELPVGANAIMGPSGSGKSSLLRVIAGLQAPTSGQVRINSSSVVRATWHTASDPRVSLMHQDYRLVSFLTVQGNLLLAAELRGRSVGRDDLSRVMSQVALPERLLHRHPGSLSGGEQQRVSIARALVCGAEVLLADEPTGALDALNTAKVADLLGELGDQAGMCVVVVTHDPAVAARMHRQFDIGAGDVKPHPA